MFMLWANKENTKQAQTIERTSRHPDNLRRKDR